ncbi:hypothetical protein MLD38_017952 [Melastoma candidum]|uniref:Uncharacterized protein n=1 Tax=Melastoma candidum TaxID=119954 RepID=A0ACB9QSC6_9MYRT|nr:hypothetical protein MLD38_017952 [Melastoma candidum]
MDSPSSDAASVPPPRDSPDPSPAPQTPERMTDVQTAIVLRSEEYRQLFRLPTEEVLVEDFNCAYQENIPVQGHMYLFAHHICFYSNIFGFETKKIIHFREITSVKRAKTAGIFPNAIEIYAGAKKYFFASFLSRDEAFNLISSGWLNHGSVSSEITDRQALTPLSSFTENGSESDSAINLTNDDDVETSERDVDAPVCMESLSGPDPEDGNLSALGQKTDDNAGSNDSGLQPTAPPSTQKAWSWKVEDVDAGRIPEDLTKVAESKFPITVEEFFNLFFSDDGFNFVESFHKRCGDKDFKCSSWKQHDHFGHTRNVSFQHPIKLYLGARYGSCQVLQKFRVFRNSNLVIQTSQEISDIPFADYFRVEGLWAVRRDGDGSCSLSVYIEVAFVKKTMFKGKIVQSTLEECREAYASWIEMAHDLLKEKNIEKREDVTPDRSITTNESTCTQDAGNIGPSGTLPPPILDSDVPKNSSLTTLDRYDGRPFLQSLVSRETIVLIEDRAMKLWSRLRSQIHLPLFVAVLFTIILLIQLSIVVLLSRSPSVQVISPAENVNLVDDTSTEAMTWLEKRLYYLKEEVSLVEARFERMQWEYSRIKQQLGELERVHRKKGGLFQGTGSGLLSYKRERDLMSRNIKHSEILLHKPPPPETRGRIDPFLPGLFGQLSEDSFPGSDRRKFCPID